MNDTALLGPWVRRFLLEHLIAERNLSRQTQRSYRDTLRLLLPFVAGQCHRSLDQLTVEQLSAAHVHGFLRHVEEVRHCTTTTRNQRLAAIRDPRLGRLRGRPQSRTHRLVRGNSPHPV